MAASRSCCSKDPGGEFLHWTGLAHSRLAPGPSAGRYTAGTTKPRRYGPAPQSNVFSANGNDAYLDTIPVTFSAIRSGLPAQRQGRKTFLCLLSKDLSPFGCVYAGQTDIVLLIRRIEKRQRIAIDNDFRMSAGGQQREQDGQQAHGEYGQDQPTFPGIGA
jgi:hypothetical protein